MKKQTKTLVEIAAAYLTVSVVLDFLLGSFQILLLLALSFEFILFGAMIFSSLMEHIPPTTRLEHSASRNGSELTRLQHLCESALSRGDQSAAEQISDRVRALAFDTVAHRLNMTETAVRTVAQQHPDLLYVNLGDHQLARFLTTRDSLIRGGDSQYLEDLLAKLEGYI